MKYGNSLSSPSLVSSYTRGFPHSVQSIWGCIEAQWLVTWQIKVESMSTWLVRIPQYCAVAMEHAQLVFWVWGISVDNGWWRTRNVDVNFSLHLNSESQKLANLWGIHYHKIAMKAVSKCWAFVGTHTEEVGHDPVHTKSGCVAPYIITPYKM